MSFGYIFQALLPICAASLAFGQTFSIRFDQLSQMRYRYIGPADFA